MKHEFIEPLGKVKIETRVNNNAVAASSCCGGAPTNNADACCKLDEEKKSEGESGCGCNVSENKTSKSSCC